MIQMSESYLENSSNATEIIKHLLIAERICLYGFGCQKP